MNSMNFGSITGPQSSLGMGTRMSLRPKGMPRMTLGKGLGVPSMGGLGVLKFADGGYASTNHPSMSYLAIEDSLHGMPQHLVPDYMMARMAEGGTPWPSTERADSFDYPKRALINQIDDLDRLRYELARRPVRQRRGSSRVAPINQMPWLHFNHRDRIDASLEQIMAEQERMQPERDDFDPASIPMGLSGARGLAGLVAPGPAMGGLSAMLHSGDAQAPEMQQRPYGSATLDPRMTDSDLRKYGSQGPELFNPRELVDRARPSLTQFSNFIRPRRAIGTAP